jgi:molybdate transport system substrate-binding protein
LIPAPLPTFLRDAYVAAETMKALEANPMRNDLVLMTAVLIFSLGSQVATAQSEVTVIAPGDMRAPLNRLGSEYQSKMGATVKPTIGSGLGTKKQVIQGDAFDVVIVQPPVKEVIASGNVVADTETPVASVAVGVAVRKGTAKPDISTPDAVKQMLLNAKSVTYPNGAAGAAAGVTLDEMFKKLGITQEMKSKLERIQGVSPAALVGRGDVEICLTFLSEIDDPNAEIVGPLPAEIAPVTKLVGFVSTHAKDPKGAKSFLKFISSAQARSVYEEEHMQSAH